MQYKFADSPDGTHTISEGYDTIVITDQVAEIDPANAGQVALAEKYGGKPVVAYVVEKKSSKKAPELD